MNVRIASAGTGKTTSLVFRYLELLAEGVPLRRIAGVTFTRNAADELRQRVGEALQTVLRDGHYHNYPAEAAPEVYHEALRELDGAVLNTIHGFMIACLRLVAPQTQLDPDFKILGEWQAQAMLEEEMTSLLYLSQDSSHVLQPVYQQASLQGARRLEPLLLQLFAERSQSESFQAESPADQALLAFYEAMYQRYVQRLANKLLAPAEIERFALNIVRRRHFLPRLAQRFRYILVDEYQDVNPMQGRFFRVLEASGAQLDIVGDPKQSIYGFRNADVDVFRQAAREGQQQAPLRHSRRHSKVLLRFLNSLCKHLADNNQGFSPAEAPEVVAADDASNAQKDKPGLFALHWVVGEASMAALRRYEAQVLAQQLAALCSHYPPQSMAVLARSYDGLDMVAEALQAQGLPYVLLRGRGYYSKSEVRDLYHALQLAAAWQEGQSASLSADSSVSLAVWLRSPFGGLDTAAIEAVLRSPAPLEHLQHHRPAVYARMQQVRRSSLAGPVAALKTLIRAPFISGKRYVDFLDSRARENVDALLFSVSEQPPGDVELLLERLEHLSGQRDAGDMPQSGEGIALLTVHGAKGLEWDVVAVFDIGRQAPNLRAPLYLDARQGRVASAGQAGFEDLKQAAAERQQQESYRLLYVAASRARDVLLLSGSLKPSFNASHSTPETNSAYQASGWAETLLAMQLGPQEKRWQRPDFDLQVWPYQPLPALPSSSTPPTRLEPAPWLDHSFPPLPFPPLYAPSRYKQQQPEHEPFFLPDPDEGESLPGRGRTVGTLVHYAISQNWSARNRQQLQNLASQEVMFPFSDEEKVSLQGEVGELLARYEALLGQQLPSLDARDEDYSELPLAFPYGGTVWQGIIDRLYRVGEQWYLEDYKSDQEVAPERYHFQLAIYARALEAIWQVKPRVQLVYLRSAQVVVLAEEVLGQALQELADYALPYGAITSDTPTNFSPDSDF